MYRNRVIILCIVLFVVFFYSCRTIISSEFYNDFYIDIHDEMDKDLLDKFVKEKSGYKFHENKIYCDNLSSKIQLQRFLVLNDEYFNSTSFYYIDVKYKSEGEYFNVPEDISSYKYSRFYRKEIIYLPQGEYRLIIDWPQERLQTLKWGDKYVIKQNFVYVDDLISYLDYNFVDEKKLLTLNLATVLTYFDSDGWIRDRTSTIFKDLDINFATLVAFLIDNGYFVHNDCESGFTIISLH